MLRATLRSLLARKVRLVLSALAVVVGVSFVTGTLVLTDTLNRTFDTLFTDINKNVSVSVRTVNAVGTGDQADRLPVPATLVPTVAKVDGVTAATGMVRGQAVLIDPASGDPLNSGGAPGIGTNWTGGTATGSEEIADGRPPNGQEIAVDKSTADKHHLTLGQRISVQTRLQPEEFTLVGTFRIGGQDSLGGAAVTTFDTATAQRLLLAPDQFTSISLAAANGVSQEQLRDRVAAVLPTRVEAITGTQLAEESASAIQDAVSGFSTFLLVFAGIAVFVGAFIIFNTFTMLVAQRVRELALLRAIGASRAQVQLSVQIEALIVGFIGATVGLALGALLAMGLRAAVGAFGISLPSGPLVFQARTFLLAYGVGLVITGLAAFVPARKAASVPPVAAMRETYVLPTRSLRTRALGGGALTVLGVICLVAGLARGENPNTSMVGAGAAFVFLGIATLSPLLAPPITQVVGIPLRAMFGTTGRLGQENAIRNPRRTASTASALMIGLALVSAFAVLGQSIKESVRETVSESLGADFYIATSNLAPFSPQVAAGLQGKPGVAVATGIRGGVVKIGDTNSSVLAGDPVGLLQVLSIKQVDGDVNALGAGSLLVDEVTAAERGLRVGAPVPVTFADGPTELTLVGTYEKSAIAGPAMIATSEFEKHSNNNLDLFVMLKLADGADPAAVRAEIDKVIKPFGSVEVRDQSEFVAQQEEQVDQLLGFVYVLLALAVVIALFGIVNTLALSVIERTREIGMLRAIGMTRQQMRMMVIVESMIISVFGAVLGVLVGSFFGWALTGALKSQGVTTFAYPVGTIIAVMIAGAIMGVLAAVFPARRAARMDILRAIATT
ncbi:FtsX-like permease family protein [Parafrankia sp. FMc6]|uniref:ABC transporter permease n=1 Tax=Parafrankia soli TaxID=2599596 RepID=UPI0034D50A19